MSSTEHLLGAKENFAGADHAFRDLHFIVESPVTNDVLSYDETLSESAGEHVFVNVQGGGGALRDNAFVNVTSGDVAVTATASSSPTTLYDGLVFDAVVGDLIGVVVGYSSGSDTEAIRVNAVTISDAAAQVNFIGPGTLGVRGWAAHANSDQAPGCTQDYIVQSGDIRGDNTVKLRLVAWLSSAGSRSVNASTSAPLHFSVKNYGQ